MTNHLFDAFRSRISASERILMATDDGRAIAYGDMLAQSAQLAHALRHFGVEPGDRVAVQVEKSPECIFLYLACLRAGAVFLPLNTAYTLAELGYFFGDAEPRAGRLRPGPRRRYRAVGAGVGCCHLHAWQQW